MKKAVILMGGLGTRLRPFTIHTPKPLLPVLNVPFFAYQLDLLKRFGIHDIVLALGYRSAHFKRMIGNGRKWGVRFRYSLEKTPLGTGGAIRKALPFLNGPTVVLNGDVLSDMHLSDMFHLHSGKNAEATLALFPVKDPSAFGLIETDSEGRILRFTEKPSPDEITVNTINAGAYLLELSFIRSIPPDKNVSIERDVFPVALKDGRALYGFVHRGLWTDIGTLKSYWQVHKDLLHKISNFPIITAKQIRRGLWAGKKTVIHPDAKIDGTVLLGEGCHVGRAVLKGAVCIGNGSQIKDGAQITDSLILDRTTVHSSCRLDHCLIGNHCHIQESSILGPGDVVADRSTVGPFAQRFSYEDDAT
ncbi:MAG TPA: NDP-sugar synthase [Elusimicrobiota bacterium]|nr:NDP-sugar synthase [Elusimicrobiota bacterium]